MTTRGQIRRVIGYVRVSTAEQGRSGLGLEAQKAAVMAACAGRGWELVATYQDVASGKSTNGRHELRRALDDLGARRAEGLMVAKLDRLSRSVVDFGRVLKLSQRHGWALVILDLDLDTSTPTGKLMANVLISVAEWERDAIAQRTKAGLESKRARGERLGRERLIPAVLERRIVRMRKRGLSFWAIAAQLTAERVETPSGKRKPWSWTSVQRVVRRHLDEPVKTRRRRVELE